MKYVTIKTSCEADVAETWIFKVPDGWEPPPDRDATIDALTDEGFEVEDIEDEVSNERDRVVLEVEVGPPGSVGGDE